MMHPIITVSIWGVFLWLPDGTGEIEPLLGLLASLIKESNGGGGRSHGLVAKSSGCSCRRFRFDSQPHMVAHNCLSLQFSGI